MSDTENTDQGRRPKGGILSFLGIGRREIDLRSSIAALVQEAGEPGEDPSAAPELDRQERALLTNVLKLREITADDVMVPRADIIAMSASVSLTEALDIMRRENHSRMPVYRAQLDDIAGMVHVKDLLAYVGQEDQFDITPLLRQPLMIAPQMPVLDLMLQMRQRQMHMALVIDEYGGIDGLVTIEDLIETIVGDISDEHDEPEGPMLAERADGTFDIDARLAVEDLEERLGAFLTASEREAEIETVGGLVFRLAGHMPTRDEVLTHESGLVFRVTDADARHIRALRMRVPEAWPDATPERQNSRNGEDAGDARAQSPDQAGA